MSEIEAIKKQNNINKVFLCYNCGTEIVDADQKYCPNCNVFLNPNNYINWKYSFYGCLCLLCVIPILIALLIGIFYI